MTREDLSDAQGKARITMYVNLDVLNIIRDEAKSMKLGYQTYINQILRKNFISESTADKATSHFLLNELNALKWDMKALRAKKR